MKKLLAFELTILGVLLFALLSTLSQSYERMGPTNANRGHMQEVGKERLVEMSLINQQH